MSYNLQLDRPWSAASEADVKVFERRWELRLPSTFRRFCLEQNGGYPPKTNNFYPVPRECKKFWDEYNVIPNAPIGVGILVLLSISELAERSIGKTMMILKDSDQLLPYRVPIASDGCGNYVQLSVDPSEKRPLFFWDHELNDEFFIAHDFDQFLGRLTSAGD